MKSQIFFYDHSLYQILRAYLFFNNNNICYVINYKSKPVIHILRRRWSTFFRVFSYLCESYSVVVHYRVEIEFSLLISKVYLQFLRKYFQYSLLSYWTLLVHAKHEILLMSRIKISNMSKFIWRSISTI